MRRLMRNPDSQFPRSAEEAKKLGKTYYHSDSQCMECGNAFKWAHNNSCMHCHYNSLTLTLYANSTGRTE